MLGRSLECPSHKYKWSCVSHFWRCKAISRNIVVFQERQFLRYFCGNQWQYTINVKTPLTRRREKCLLNCRIWVSAGIGVRKIDDGWSPVASFTNNGLTFIPAWISNHTPSKVWNEITYPFLNQFYNGCYYLSMLGLKLIYVNKRGHMDIKKTCNSDR